MALVLDSSISLSWFFPDEKSKFTDAALALAVHEDCWVPAVWRLEFPNALLAAERRKRLSRPERLQVLDEVTRLNLRVDPRVHELRAISEIAERHGLSTYDAAYLELASRLDSALITLDAALAAACAAAGIDVHAPGRTSASQLLRRYNV
ncbi:MAG TPA: type II toxin-antitoxin system VapC family toxin [Burkholderiales bacterium]|nr:type II toxin-antitoxin system VapC family toxin [Burkholderiales bacterium]